MKKKYFLLLIFFLIICNTCFSQKEGDIVTLKTYCKVLKFENISGNDTIKANFLEPSIKFIVNNIGTDSIALKALNFTTDELKMKIYNNKIYYISKNEFDKSASIIEKRERLSVGILTLPFKARPQDNFSFDTEFNLSTTLNWNIKSIYDAHLNLQVGAGIGSVNLNASNSAGITDLKAQDVACLNLFSGVMIEYKKVQAGIYVGVDQINNQNQYKWQHNGNMWFGFGIGFNVFNISLGKEKENQ
ncbi:MAG: hypothetical protein EOO44_16055 [Flavobacterium sp.]|nr:MAG: hypothetical protein EOO44_16055 [Flavobacterium sp.]